MPRARTSPRSCGVSAIADVGATINNRSATPVAAVRGVIIKRSGQGLPVECGAARGPVAATGTEPAEQHMSKHEAPLLTAPDPKLHSRRPPANRGQPRVA